MNLHRWHLISKLIGLTLLLSLLCSCGLYSYSPPSQKNIDTSFLTGDSCTLPCWHGLIINKSTKDEVMTTLDNLPFIEHNTYKEYSSTWENDLPATEVLFKCASHPAVNCGEVVLADNILRVVRIYPEYDLTIKNAVDKLGSPDFVEYEWPSISGKCSFILAWAISGVSVTIYDGRNYNECESIIDGNQISPSLIVETITYASFDDESKVGGCCHRVSWPGIKDE